MSDSDSLSKETTFTPGPWSVGEPHPQNACAYVLGADGDEVATLYGGDQAKKDDDGIWGSQPIRDATANLIAAAPCLFEALDRLLNCVDGVHDRDQYLRCKERAVQALSKARGPAE